MAFSDGEKKGKNGEDTRRKSSQELFLYLIPKLIFALNRLLCPLLNSSPGENQPSESALADGIVVPRRCRFGRVVIVSRDKTRHLN